MVGIDGVLGHAVRHDPQAGLEYEPVQVLAPDPGGAVPETGDR